MSKPSIPISEVMTPAPHGIAADETLQVARQRLFEHKIRHLPVRLGGKVLGIISERDLYMLSMFPEIDFHRAKVALVMTADPYCVGPHTPLAEVAKTMAERRIGSALIVDDQQHLLGIFTDTDALTALSKL